MWLKGLSEKKMRAEKDSRNKYKVKNNCSILFCFLYVFLWAVEAHLFFNSFLFLFAFEYFFCVLCFVPGFY